MLKIAVFRGSRRIGCQVYYLRAQYGTELRLNHLTPECKGWVDFQRLLITAVPHDPAVLR